MSRQLPKERSITTTAERISRNAVWVEWTVLPLILLFLARGGPPRNETLDKAYLALFNYVSEEWPPAIAEIVFEFEGRKWVMEEHDVATLNRLRRLFQEAKIQSPERDKEQICGAVRIIGKDEAVNTYPIRSYGEAGLYSLWFPIEGEGGSLLFFPGLGDALDKAQNPPGR